MMLLLHCIVVANIRVYVRCMTVFMSLCFFFLFQMLRDKTKETALKHVNEVTSFLDDVNSQKNPVANRIKVIMVRSISLVDKQFR